MANIIIRPGWYLPEREANSEQDYQNRRQFMKTLGLGALGVGLIGCKSHEGQARSEMMPGDDLPEEKAPNADLYPAKRNDTYTVDREMTSEKDATTFNNFYEFSEQKDQVHKLVEKFEVRPWDFEITGLVNKPQKLTVDELVRKLPLEERVYRFRCVEAWAMTIPWTGIPLAKILALAEPMSSAKYVRFLSFYQPAQAPNQKRSTWYNWPYYEGLSIEEATNELTMGVTGLFGKELPKQNGAPLRIIVPWKYGYKSAKSIVKIELVEEQPKTFWNDLAPKEYSFLSNVNPEIPHPRWSQATERLLGGEERVETKLYNGYGEYVAGLYSS
ncbi:MAG: protein-methionine-sulfoxide reductase catalytic subunit MsrP [Candidatus Kapaibacterium sp.]